jgi:hypothetical protein
VSPTMILMVVCLEFLRPSGSLNTPHKTVILRVFH